LKVADIAGEKIDQALQKRMPSHEDLNPRRRFMIIRLSPSSEKTLNSNPIFPLKKLSWVNNSHIPRLLYNKMIVWEVYEEYMKAENNNYLSDKKFITRLITELFSNSEDLQFKP
jgi:N utilization substance protein B